MPSSPTKKTEPPKTNTFLFDGTYHYDFLSTGYFTLITKKGEPYYSLALPALEKTLNHLAYIGLWSLLIFLTPYLHRILMALIITHLFFAGIRLTQLLMTGTLRPLLLPPLWIRLSRKLKKKPALQILQEHNLHTHPGLLANLAISQLCHNQHANATHTLQLATQLTESPHLHNLTSSILKITP